MCPPAISLDQLATLPVVYRVVIPPDYEDRNGHMNMRWYLALYDEAGDAMYPMLALTADYFQESGMGGFDLEHHLWYLAEVRIGDTVVIRVRFVAERQADALFDVHGERNTGRVSSIFECVHAHADLKVRRTATFPAHVAARIDDLITAHSALTWPAPVSGSMGVQTGSQGHGNSGGES